MTLYVTQYKTIEDRVETLVLDRIVSKEEFDSLVAENNMFEETDTDDIEPTKEELLAEKIKTDAWLDALERWGENGDE